MTSTVEKLEKGIAKLTIEIDSIKFEEGLKYSFNKNKSKFKLDGFRVGKAPRSLVEKMYGEQVLYEEAVDYLLPEAYTNAVRENELKIVSRPDVDIVQIGKGQNLIITAVVTLKPDVTLGEYKGVEIEKADIQITDEEINDEIAKVVETNSRLITVEDRPVKMGDVVTIDFEGFVDGVAFEDGSAEDYDLEIGSKMFIDTFEEQLIGKDIGDTVDVVVTFPENYTNEELSGKQATFKVVVNEITEKELPEIDDDFAQDVSDFDTLEEYKNDIRSTLEKAREENLVIERENRVITKVVDNSTMDVPAVMIENQIDKLVHNFKVRMKENGLTMEQYFSFTGQDMNYMRQNLREQAEEQVRISLVLDAIVEKENITVTEDEFNERLEKIAESMGLDVDKVKEGLIGERKEEFEDEIKLQKAVELLVDTAKEV